ncbi:MAG: DNA-binding protein [Gammaproteobacteria bacterium]|nr:MAG: DNA-binding protein [Gammaproteobacteria bacterium]
MVKRFIAGAVCPQCELMDKIYVEGEGKVARCAACGYELQQPDASAPSQSVSEQENTAQVVTLVNFKAAKTPRNNR